MTNCNVRFLTLDIETSTLMETVKNNDGDLVQHPIAVWLAYGVTKMYNYKGEQISVLRFREWHELHTYYDRISQDLGNFQIICYVHNLGYEFDYIIKNLSQPQKFLTNSSHNVISSTLKRYPNIQFRCSYLLSGYSLRKLGQMVNLEKLESEYRQIFPKDKVTDDEWKYCERDNDIVAKYIAEICLKEYNTLFDIPYTKTGRVRKVLRKHYEETETENCQWDEMPPENCIEAMNKAFNGGIVISNPMFTDIPLKNVHSYDITSSYPFAMASELFPRNIFKYDIPPKQLYKGDYYIANIRFKNIRSKFNWQWLSISKLENIQQCEFFNGKLISGKSCDRYVTNIDFEMILETYEFEYEIIEYYQLYNIDYLPECFRRTLIEIGVKKVRLKAELKKYEEGTQDYYSTSIDYALAKNDFNSIYGMMVEKLIKEEYQIDENFLWHTKSGKYEYKKHMKRNFLFGIFITAYARRNLLRAIIKNCPETFVYADTDSIKFIGENNFIDTNGQLAEFMQDIEEFSDLGRFDYEGTYDEFKTLGAKKYCYKKNDKFYVVVAGLPKTTEYNINTIDDFKCGVTYQNCKLGKIYLTQSHYFELDDDTDTFIRGDLNVAEWLEENEIETMGGVGLYPTSYKLDMTPNDKYIISMHKGVIENWLKEYKLRNGIDLKEYCPMTVHIQ